MKEWLIDYGSWALAPWGLLGMYATGRKKTWGWLLALTTQVLWAGYAVGTAQYGFLIGTCSYAAVYLRNWLVWRREDRERKLPPCSSRSRYGHPCAHRQGHSVRHGDPSVGASGINWDDDEGAAA